MLAAGVLLVAGGCGTPLGRYFAHRARDLGEVFRVEMNGGLGLGAVVEAGGVAHVGLGAGAKPFWGGIGWSYGRGHAFIGAPHAVRARGGHAAVPCNPIPVGDPRWVLHVRHAPPHAAVHTCWWLLPGLFGESIVASGNGVSRAWLWSDAALREPSVIDVSPGQWTIDGVDLDRPRLLAAHRWNHVHAFDVSADVYAGVLHVAAGVSLGELADFVLGWFGVDLAGDDGPTGGH